MRPRVASRRMGAVFVDLDRTLLVKASGPYLTRAARDEGVIGFRGIPGDRLMYALYDRFGETLAAIGLTRLAAFGARGWDPVKVRAAGARAVGALSENLAPFAPGVLAKFRSVGYLTVLATTTPFDMIEPFAEAMGFDAVLATRYEVRDGRYTGRLDGGFVWGMGKLSAVKRWVQESRIDLSECHAYSDSVFDIPLLTSVGHPHALNPDPRLAVVAKAKRWPIEYWDRPPGVPSIVGWEPYHVLRPFVREEAFPYARFKVGGIDSIPRRGGALIVANHRSYFDVVALAIVAAKVGRPVRFLAKAELFEVFPLGAIARGIGGIPVKRGSGSTDALEAAEAALGAGEIVVVLPEGTIPRGTRFFDPILKGKTGAARLAAATGVPVVPVGLWGTEQVWPRSSRVPLVSGVLHPPLVEVNIGKSVKLGLEDPVDDTKTLMDAISRLLPKDARLSREPSAVELSRTYPPGDKPPRSERSR